jgi:hypothetical protein
LLTKNADLSGYDTVLWWWGEFSHFCFWVSLTASSVTWYWLAKSFLKLARVPIPNNSPMPGSSVAPK